MRRKTEDRRLGFVKAAGKLFIERGFGAVTMEAVAAEAAASKATLYGYFSSKEALFEAFVNEAGKGGIEEIEATRGGSDVVQVLRRLGMAYLDLVTRPDVIDLNRLIMGEAGRQPQLSRIFYENGPRKTLIALSETIAGLMEAGKLRHAGLRETSLYFKALCEAGLVERQLWGLDAAPDQPTRQAAVERAILVFLAAFGPQDEQQAS
ncbi:TetR/AcrR family transcriptional regulator [Rhizobium sp. CSW-27]|uniref:TetR/AcrR family transcriptional regulator n=1 Tax=Rhizobium sp. CSW-27 TaxID=2839985 RepID=UPI001C00ABCB|nr:TetR/AcrR family transcriptional regulator [Rhizobium sp. CSW-27]MBT9372827.1 TetR/AcrR family transcriptional regulator [Rhizobium sp. CSW-27]